MLYYRPADKLVAVATHGRGLFTTDAFATTSVANEYFLVGNPYAAPVRPAFIELSAGLAGNFWMWDASDINFGRYVAFDRITGQRLRLDLKGITHQVFRADSAATERFIIVMSKPAPPAASIRLEAAVDGRSVRLDWVVRDGYELNAHVLERLEADGSRKVISTFGPAVDGERKYSWVDADAPKGLNRYLVTASGRSGLKTMSNPATADIPVDVRGISLFPNPVRNDLRVSVSVSLNQDTRLNILDAKGTVVHRQRRMTAGGNMLVDVRDWPAGVYRVVLSDATGILATESFIKE